MKSALLLLLLPAIALGTEGDGRYFVTQAGSPIGAILVDSKTGKSWSTTLSENGVVVWTPVRFSCGKDSTSSLPDCSSKITFLDENIKAEKPF